MEFSSRLLENAVNEFAKIPGVGRKTALRYVLHLLRQKEQEVALFTATIDGLKKDIRYCKFCYNISDREVCEICANPRRDEGVICVVEDIRDVMAIENTGQFLGRYHVLNGIISPMDGIGPADLTVDGLLDRIKAGGVKELIMALSTTMEGDTTNFYIYKKVAELNQTLETPVVLSVIARGVALGDELEYADELTLGRSIRNRVAYEQQLSSRWSFQ